MVYSVIGALVVGLSLGVFGSGGSILTVPVLLYLLHHEDKVAIAESLGIVGAIALLSAVPYAKAKLVEWPTALLFGLPGMAGTYLGAWLAKFVSGPVQLLVFAAVMIFAALLMWRRDRGGLDPDEGERPQHRSVVKIGIDGLLVGVLTGFVGVGGGFLIVPALVLLGGVPMRRAVATSLVIIAAKSATGFWKYIHVLDEMQLSVDWHTIGVFVLVGAAGSLLGRRVNAGLNQAALQRGFALFLVLMSIFIVGREGLDLIRESSGTTSAVESGGK
ncbi:MAG: sulfite exporter TauE/SafE family protein [Planctomycetes bacterium]|nr:sulfite exporter TauE/SafE family protein [Planctomycetota bacterium]